MATDPRTIALLSERLSCAGDITNRKMFGEYGVYCDGSYIGVVCDDRFHLKPTAAAVTFGHDLDMAAAYTGAKPSLVVPADRWDDSDWLGTLVRVTIQDLQKH